VSRRLREISIELDVPFRHVDLLGVVWHGHYYKYMEEARQPLLRECGVDDGELIGGRYGLFVIESKCRHAFPLRYGERMRVEAWISDIERRIAIRYEITNLTRERRAARGHTILAMTDRAGNLLLETPEEVRRRVLG
jgi:acyl-CoA thioester hydrolase